MEEASSKMARYFGAIIENRDYITTQHARRVGMISYVLLLKLKASQHNYNLTDQDVRMISSAATLHDVGKLRLPDKIINKASRLTDAEYEIYQSHTYKGKKMFDDVMKHMSKNDPDREFFECCGEICLFHHERYFGDGYPEKKKGDEIPIGAQVVGLADAYEDALGDRLHKKAISRFEVYNMITSGECGSFSPELVKVFMDSRADLEQLLAKEDKDKKV
ncbi:MAG: HD domain-containing protein [Eubacterium sp.]|nr:HD domain-containing protein [Eubacterium sp.]